MEQPLTILLVEDDFGHARLIEKNLRRAGIANDIIKIHDGYDAHDFLLGEGKYEGNSLPRVLLVLLDLNLPGMNGTVILSKMKNSTRTKDIPVVILTTTAENREIAKCYELGCNMYITKPVDYNKFSEVIHKLGMFLQVIKVPDGV